MKFGKIRKILICLAAALSMCFAVCLSGCNVETDHPEAEITYSFNGEKYVVKYKLYRNMYPHTVRHFVELADEGFYNNTIIHNYDTNDWFTGAYAYDKDRYTSLTEEGQMSEYLSYNAGANSLNKEDAYVKLFKEGKLSPSVFQYESHAASSALPTVMGEFYNNIHQEIEKGALSANNGCLKMFYYEKTGMDTVYTLPTDDQVIIANYKNNCATSVFAIQTGVSSVYNENSYCVFAMVDTDFVETFDNFVDAVRDYVQDWGTDTSFCSSVTTTVDNTDEYAKKDADKKISVTFKVPKTPIVIESVKITKY